MRRALNSDFSSQRPNNRQLVQIRLGDPPAGVMHVSGSGSRLGHYQLPAGDTTSEPVFVARGEDAVEDDGWLLAVQLDYRIPSGFHGNWVGSV
jgi:Retinal pigment epithelial membrane protein